MGSDLEHVADRHNRERHQHRKKRQKRRESVQEAVGAFRHKIFLGEEFYRVREEGVDEPEVWQTEPPPNPENRRTVRADAFLYKGGALALEPKQTFRQVQHQYED